MMNIDLYRIPKSNHAIRYPVECVAKHNEGFDITLEDIQSHLKIESLITPVCYAPFIKEDNVLLLFEPDIKEPFAKITLT